MKRILTIFKFLSQTFFVFLWHLPTGKQSKKVVNSFEKLIVNFVQLYNRHGTVDLHVLSFLVFFSDNISSTSYVELNVPISWGCTKNTIMFLSQVLRCLSQVLHHMNSSYKNLILDCLIEIWKLSHEAFSSRAQKRLTHLLL